MSWSGTYISKPVSMADVKAAIGSSSNDLATLCTSSYINMWSKFKPIFHSGVEPLTDAQFADDTGGTSGYRIKYGIKRANSYGTTDLVNSAGVVQDRQWEYIRPSGGTSSPYRLSDFASKESNYYGYSPNAAPPFQFSIPTNNGILPIPAANTDGTVVTFYFRFGNAVDGWSSSHSISPTEILTSSELNYYPTVGFFFKSGNYSAQYYVSSQYKLSEVISSHGYVAIVHVDTKTMRDAMNGSSGSRPDLMFADDATWTTIMFLSYKYCDGTAANQLTSGNVSRLQYKADWPDRHLFKVKTSTWMDYVSKLWFTVTMRKRSNTQFDVTQIVVEYNASQRINGIAVEIEYGIVGGAESGSITGTSYGTVIAQDGQGNCYVYRTTDTLTMQGSTTKTYNTNGVTQPNINITSTLPGGEKVAYVIMRFTYGGVPVGDNVNIRCDTISSGATTTATAKIKG